ncbi:MAG: division/cell wall cluster transcriptional repressor MraZ [Candidatus Shapirobacteria bacterium]
MGYYFLQNGEEWFQMVKSGEMLIGQYCSKVSPKGRVAFPKKFRDQMGDQLVVTRGYEGCLIVVSENDWKLLLEGTENKPFVFEATRDTLRFLLGNAAQVELDEQGRFVLAIHLRNYSGLEQGAVFLGLQKYVEIWDKKRWADRQNYLSKNINQISERLGNN